MAECIGLSCGDKDCHRMKRVVMNRLFCSCPTPCPLLAKGMCIHAGFLSRCVYGQLTQDHGPSTRSNSYAKTKKAWEDEAKTKPMPQWAKRVIAEIGEYVYLPYPHMDMNTEVPFVSHACLFVSGTPFVKKDLFNAEMVLKMAAFHPQALMGGEITDYQNKSVPEFLSHLKLLKPEMFKAACGLDPKLAERVAQFPSEVKATIGKIEPGCIEGWRIGKTLKPEGWDGTLLTVKGDFEELRPLFSHFYGEGEAILTFRPKASSEITVFGADLIRKLVSEDITLLG